MKSLFSRLIARFDALAQRERRLVAFAVLCAVLLIGWSLFIDPAFTRMRVAERGMVDKRAQLVALQTQMTALSGPENNPEVQASAELAGLKKQLNAMNERVAAMEGALVPPQRMAGLLENMIGRKSGLRLLSLRTLPVTPVLDKKEGAETTTLVKSAAGLYKHGVEIRLEGGYAELAEYLTRLEKAPQKLLWSSVSLSAEQHPKLVLTLSVFTLSLDRTWLIV